MRFALFAIGLLLAAPAWAGPPDSLYPPVNERQSDASKRRYSGNVMSVDTSDSDVHTTTDRFEFGFQSNWVSICIRANAAVAATADVYFRFEHNASTDLWADRLATQSSYYINGVNGVRGLGVPAMTIAGGGDGTGSRCISMAVQARGLTLHQVSSATATLDVIAQ